MKRLLEKYFREPRQRVLIRCMIQKAAIDASRGCQTSVVWSNPRRA